MVEHISGQSVWVNRDNDEYDGLLLHDLMPDVKANIYRQLPWVKGIEAPDLSSISDRIEKNKVVYSWLSGLAAIHASWHELERDPLRPSMNSPGMGFHLD